MDTVDPNAITSPFGGETNVASLEIDRDAQRKRDKLSMPASRKVELEDDPASQVYTASAFIFVSYAFSRFVYS